MSNKIFDDENNNNSEPENYELNYFEELAAVNVNDKAEDKNGLTYLSWAFAWGELKKRHPTANYKVYENAEGWIYHTDGRTAWVKVSVTVNDIEHIEYLPVMNYSNKSIKVGDALTSFEVNKAIQRALTKAIARHGLGLYIYAGEDLPEAPEGSQNANQGTSQPEAKVRKRKQPDNEPDPVPDDPRAIYQELKDVIAKNGLNGADLAAMFNLSKTSTAADLKAALDYARGLVR